MSPGMTPIGSSDHAEHSLHCPVSGPTEHRSAWMIRGSGPACCRRPAIVHAERSASLTLPYKGRESPQGDSVPLENPCNLERKQDGDGAREGPPLGRRPLRSPHGGDGYRLRAWSRFPDQAGLCETRGLLGPGVCPTPGVYDRG